MNPPTTPSPRATTYGVTHDATFLRSVSDLQTQAQPALDSALARSAEALQNIESIVSDLRTSDQSPAAHYLPEMDRLASLIIAIQTDIKHANDEMSNSLSAISSVLPMGAAPNRPQIVPAAPAPQPKSTAPSAPAAPPTAPNPTPVR